MNKLAAVLLWSTFSFCLEAQINLGTAAPFGVLAGQAVINTGPTQVIGVLGVSPGTSVAGFPPGLVFGGIHSADAVALQAQSDLTTAYNAAAVLGCTTSLPADLGGLTLTPGVYCRGFGEGLTGLLTLDAQGDANAQFVFQMSSTLTTASASSMVLVNSAQASNVFWQIGSSATLGTNSSFFGTIMALTSINMNTGAAMILGRALARNGSVTLDTNSITVPPVPIPTPTPTPTPTPPTTPAPSSLILLSIGLLFAGIYQLRRRQSSH